jgi:hypothetical protein
VNHTNCSPAVTYAKKKRKRKKKTHLDVPTNDMRGIPIRKG